MVCFDKPLDAVSKEVPGKRVDAMRTWIPVGLLLPLILLNAAIYGQNEHPVAAPDSIVLSGRE
jgi:hypothetical protein